MKTVLLGGAASVALALLLVPALGGCLTPPLILPGGETPEDLARLPYPPGSEAVAIEIEPGVSLRGLFVPADAGAPIVVHLLESSGSFTPCILSRAFGPLSVAKPVRGRTVAWDLADLGFASLFVDYRGVGPSGGERDPRHLAGDAEAIYAEALRRAGGDESRLVLRGTSIGGLAAAHLLDDGRRPAAVILIAPVRDETVVANYASAYHNALIACLVAPWFRRGVGTDLERSLRDSTVPALVITTDDDELLPPDEQALLAAAVAREGADFVTVARGDRALGREGFSINGEEVGLPGDHFWLAHSARGLLPDERRLLRQAFAIPPDGERRVDALIARLPEDVRAQFPVGSAPYAGLRDIAAIRLHVDALLAASLVLAQCSTAEAVAYLDTSRRSPDARGPPPEAWFGSRDRAAVLRRLDLFDPAGRVSVAIVLNTAAQVELTGSKLFSGTTWSLADVLDFVRGKARLKGGRRDALRTVPFNFFRPDGTHAIVVALDPAWTALTVEQAVSEADACRLVLRAILKGVGLDERVVTDSAGRHQLEVRDGAAWQALDPLILLEAGDG